MLTAASQRAQIAVSFALVLAGCLVTLFIATLDLQALAVAYNRADTTALLAAQAGASAIDPNQVYAATSTGAPIVLNPVLVANNCRSVIYTPNPPPGFKSYTCTVATGPNGSQYVIATIQWDSLFPVPMPGFGSPIVTQVRNGYPAYGCRTGTYYYTPLGAAQCT